MARYNSLPTDSAIIRRFTIGMNTREIGQETGVSSDYAKKVLKRHGYDPEKLSPGPSYTTNEMWSLPEDALRYAIYRKAQKGARDTLRGKNG